MHPVLWFFLIAAVCFVSLPLPTRLLLFAAIFIADYFLQSESPTIHSHSATFNAQCSLLCPSLQRRFYPSFWFSNRHAQTIFGHAIRTVPVVRFRREEVALPDGGAVYLDWLKPELENDNVPIVVVLPGISGGSHENYVRHLLLELHRHSWQSVVFNFRGAADSRLHTPMPYTIFGTEDLKHVLRYLQNTRPTAPLYAVGFSMGANVLVKYLGEEGALTPLRAAVSVSNPFNIKNASARLSRFGTRHVYGRRMINNMRKYVRRHRDVLKRHDKVDFDLMFSKQIDSVRAVNDLLMRPMLGSQTLEEYFTEASSDRMLPNVQIPLLCVSALDDPMVPAESVPVQIAEQNPNVMFVITRKGGHVGWMTDFNVLRLHKSWMDKVVVEYLHAAMKLQSQQVWTV